MTHTRYDVVKSRTTCTAAVLPQRTFLTQFHSPAHQPMLLGHVPSMPHFREAVSSLAHPSLTSLDQLSGNAAGSGDREGTFASFITHHGSLFPPSAVLATFLRLIASDENPVIHCFSRLKCLIPGQGLAIKSRIQPKGRLFKIRNKHKIQMPQSRRSKIPGLRFWD